MKRLCCVAILLFSGSTGWAQDKGFTVTLPIEKEVKVPTPVSVPLSLSAEMAKWHMVAAVVGKQQVWGQLTAPGIVHDHVNPAGADAVRRDLHVVLTPEQKLKAGTLSLTFTPLKTGDIYIPEFRWIDTKGRHTDLVFSKSPHQMTFLRYMYQAYDDSSPDARNKTYKVFHHLFDPSGKRIVTNGGHTSTEVKDKLLFPHHRGIQMGWNKTIYADGKKKADTWHCQKDDHQSHQGFLGSEEGYLLGRHRVAVNWHGEKKEVIVKEQRELTVYKTPGGTLVEFAARLTPAKGKVKLDGDPQHAGFQFRAHNDVATKTAKHTYYVRPDGKGKPGVFRNWPKDKQHVNLPWNALSFMLDEKSRYTICYLDHPRNPRETRHSERDYGRFGCYFEYELTPERPLVLNYRLWLQDGEMTVEQVQAISEAFMAPPKAAPK